MYSGKAKLSETENGTENMKEKTIVKKGNREVMTLYIELS